MTKVMILSDAPSFQTGYGVATKNLGRQLFALGHEISFCGMTEPAPLVYEKMRDRAGTDGDFAKIYGAGTTLHVEKAFRAEKPDLAFHIRDLFAFTPKYQPQAYSLKAIPGCPKVINWIPVQAPWYPQEAIDAAKREGDLTVVFTDWGAQELMFDGIPFNKIEYCWLGYDPEIFKPLAGEDKKKLKSSFSWDPEHKIIGCVGVPDQDRKDFSTLLRTAAVLINRGGEFKNLDVYIHSNPEGAFNLPHLINRLKIKGHVLFPVRFFKGAGVTEEKLNRIYNALDAYVTCTRAEGFNVPMVEAMAAGTPVAVSQMPNHEEICGDGATYLPTRQIIPTNWSYEWLTDYEKAADVLAEVLLEDEQKKAARVIRQGERAALLTWKKSAEKMVDIVNRHSKTELGGVTL